LVEPSFIAIHDVEREVIALGSMSSEQIWCHIRARVLVPISKQAGSSLGRNLSLWKG
jgi:hypothetical protein